MTRFRPPLGPGVRVDSAVVEGAAILPFYDSMIAKVIVHDDNRRPRSRGRSGRSGSSRSRASRRRVSSRSTSFAPASSGRRLLDQLPCRDGRPPPLPRPSSTDPPHPPLHPPSYSDSYDPSRRSGHEPVEVLVVDGPLGRIELSERALSTLVVRSAEAVAGIQVRRPKRQMRIVVEPGGGAGRSWRGSTAGCPRCRRSARSFSALWLVRPFDGYDRAADTG